jgi:hypothetical protein
MMYLALSYDHRIVDGKEAVTFLVRVKEMPRRPRTFRPRTLIELRSHSADAIGLAVSKPDCGAVFCVG